MDSAVLYEDTRGAGKRWVLLELSTDLVGKKFSIYRDVLEEEASVGTEGGERVVAQVLRSYEDGRRCSACAAPAHLCDWLCR